MKSDRRFSESFPEAGVFVVLHSFVTIFAADRLIVLTDITTEMDLKRTCLAACPFQKSGRKVESG